MTKNCLKKSCVHPFTKRNIRLAGGEGDILTAEERKRVEFILETLDELGDSKEVF